MTDRARPIVHRVGVRRDARVADADRAARGDAGAGETRSAVPDILAPGLRLVLVGINPGRASAAAGVHFANPRNDFWRLLAASGLTPAPVAPGDQRSLLSLGIGITNAALRTTPGSGDLRAADFAGSADRLAAIATDLRPAVMAFVGKEAYRGVFRERPSFGEQRRTLAATRLFVLPSTSPANAAVSWDERLHWFRELATLVAAVTAASGRAPTAARAGRPTSDPTAERTAAVATRRDGRAGTDREVDGRHAR